MSKLRAFSGPVPDLERAWPEWLSLADPFAGDERVDDPIEPDRILRIAKAIGRDPVLLAEQDARFLRTYAQVLDGRATMDALAVDAEYLDLCAPFPHDWRRANPARKRLVDGWLGETAEDLVPDVGVHAPDRILGPWADMAVPRRVLLTAASLLVYTPLNRQSVRPAARARDSKPFLPLWIRNGIKAVFLAPPMLYRVAADGSLTPRLPLAEGWVPEGPVEGVPMGVGDVLGRAVLGQDGRWWLASALPLGEVPEDLDPVLGRLQIAGWRLRRHAPRLTWEDLLRDRAEVLYRTLCEWGWHQWPDSLWQSWQSWSAVAPPES